MFHPSARAIFWAIACGITGLSHLAAAGESAADLLLQQGKARFQTAYNAWDVQGFAEAEKIFKQAAELKTERQSLALAWTGSMLFHEAIFYLYGRPEERNKKLGENYLDRGIALLYQARQLDPKWPETYALLGVMKGMKIQQNPWTLFQYGPGIEQHRKAALALAEDNPRVHYLTGISLWQAPELFGGGRTQALEHMLQAEKLFEEESMLAKSLEGLDWGYSTCLAFIGDIYFAAHDYPAAYRYYQKTLLINPQDLKGREGLERLEKQTR
jgi:tetratricopeptide (TPR) repeat protein